MSSGGVSELVRAAAAGDQRAWDGLVERYAALVWSVARAHRLSDEAAADVSQVTWLRLVEHLDRIRNVEGLGSWLATTARHESLRAIRRAGRQLPSGEGADLELVDDAPPPAARLLERERDQVLWQAFERLPERCRRLLRLLTADPPPAYDEISAALDMPIGSIGPTRGRCLENLRRQAEALGITGE